MGGLRTVFYIIVVIVAIIFVIYYVNVALFCKESSQLDFKLFKVNCGLIPDKTTQLDYTFLAVCSDFKANYSCDMSRINSVNAEYTEFGKEPRSYSLIELCHLKNQYFFNEQCAQLCGCTGI